MTVSWCLAPRWLQNCKVIPWTQASNLRKLSTKKSILITFSWVKLFICCWSEKLWTLKKSVKSNQSNRQESMADVTNVAIGEWPAVKCWDFYDCRAQGAAVELCPVQCHGEHPYIRYFIVVSRDNNRWHQILVSHCNVCPTISRQETLPCLLSTSSDICWRHFLW